MISGKVVFFPSSEFRTEFVMDGSVEAEAKDAIRKQVGETGIKGVGGLVIN